MDRAQVETIELDEKVWQKWIEKGRSQDLARGRRWRIIGSVAAGLLLLASGVYKWIGN
jgi:fructose-1,6-bisphosphatase/inositol monophosphatase family enzyme